jgi:hypothetical protein
MGALLDSAGISDRDKNLMMREPDLESDYSKTLKEVRAVCPRRAVRG